MKEWKPWIYGRDTQNNWFIAHCLDGRKYYEIQSYLTGDDAEARAKVVCEVYNNGDHVPTSEFTT